ncbi:MAG: hypothetical protein ACTJGH_00495 [Peptoniphilaceae bacterium]
MEENKTSEAQLRAVARWKEKNKEKQKKYNYKSKCKSFIIDYATEKDLKDVEKFIEERRKK